MRPIDAVTGPWRMDRRDFLRASSASLAGLATMSLGQAAPEPPGPQRPRLRFGMLTDPHYADAEPLGTRFYRESLGKVREAVGRLNGERVEFLAALGDLKDMAPREPDTRTQAHLAAIEAEIQQFKGPTFHVLGNHDMDNLSKPQFLAGIVNTGIPKTSAYYAFSRGALRFLVLDACVTAEGRDYDHGKFDWRDSYVPAVQIDWLRKELTASAEPVIVLCHQRLDGTKDECVRNSADVRAVLEESRKVLVAFHGHDHPGGHTLMGGIHYYTLRAVVEGSGPEQNAYAVVEVAPELDVTVTGFRRAVSMTMEHAALAGTR
ncbi:MAG: metallophosphoesterase [Vicinamibacterales bacterium]